MLLPTLVFAALLLPKQTPAGFISVDVGKHMSVLLPEDTLEVDLDPAKLGVAMPKGKCELHTYMKDRTVFEVTAATLELKVDEKRRRDIALAQYLSGYCNTTEISSIKKQRDILLDGWPGLEVICSGKTVAIMLRTYMVDQTIYMVSVAYPITKGRPAESDTFLGSFAISPAPQSGPLKTPGPVFEQFIPPGWDCSIGMPGTPRLAAKQIAQGKGQGFARYEGPYGNRLYVVGIVGIPNEAPDDQVKPEIITQMVKAMAGKPTGKPMEIVRDSIGFESQTFTFPLTEGLEGWGRVDVAFVNHRAYTIAIACPSGHAGSPDIDEFFNSFKLLPPDKDAKTTK